VTIKVDKIEFDELKRKVQIQELEIERLRRIAFGVKSEKAHLLQDPNQMQLHDQNDLAALVEVKEEKRRVTKIVNRSVTAKQNHPGRNPLPEHLPLEEITIEPKEDTSKMKFIRNEISETLDYVPGKLIRKRIIRPIYLETIKSRITKKKKHRLVVAELPERPIPKGIPEAGLLAYLFVCKYVDHLPFHRIIERFRREFNYELSRATVSRWLAKSCELIKPLYDHIKDKVLDCDYLMVDETRIKVQQEGQPGKCHEGWLWLYENPHTKLVIYDYQRTRSSVGPLNMLKNFNGHIQTDGYSSYQLVKKVMEIKGLLCWAHARRKFVEAYNFDKKVVQEIIDLIKGLYKIEKDLRQANATHVERYEKRQETSLPILNQIKTWCKDRALKYPPKTPVSEAIKYLLSRWKSYIEYTTDGKFEIDNNLVENSVRPVALGRKNYLFCGTDAFAEYTAMMYSLFTCCRRNGVEPIAWLKDVLERLPNHSVKKLGILGPGEWVKQG